MCMCARISGVLALIRKADFSRKRSVPRTAMGLLLLSLLVLTLHATGAYAAGEDTDYLWLVYTLGVIAAVSILINIACFAVLIGLRRRLNEAETGTCHLEARHKVEQTTGIDGALCTGRGHQYDQDMPHLPQSEYSDVQCGNSRAGEGDAQSSSADSKNRIRPPSARSESTGRAALQSIRSNDSGSFISLNDANEGTSDRSIGSGSTRCAEHGKSETERYLLKYMNEGTYSSDDDVHNDGDSTSDNDFDTSVIGAEESPPPVVPRPASSLREIPQPVAYGPQSEFGQARPQYNGNVSQLQDYGSIRSLTSSLPLRPDLVAGILKESPLGSRRLLLGPHVLGGEEMVNQSDQPGVGRIVPLTTSKSASAPSHIHGRVERRCSAEEQRSSSSNNNNNPAQPRRERVVTKVDRVSGLEYSYTEVEGIMAMPSSAAGT